jgi:hypothetical protein
MPIRNVRQTELFELKTDFKTLKYGMDRPGGGSSDQPYVRFPIDDKNVIQSIRDYYNTNRTSLDFPMRGGAASAITGQQYLSPAAQVDALRIFKFLKDNPRGKAFLTKQVLLQRSNPRIETQATYQTKDNLTNQIYTGTIPNTWVYNSTGANTLYSVTTAGTGTYGDRIGLNAFQPGQKFYADTVAAQALPSNNGKTNRLVAFYKTKMVSALRNSALADITLYNDLGFSLNRNILFDYLQGPGSVYGAGKTVIRRFVDSTKLSNQFTLTYDQLSDPNRTATKYGVPVISDFRKDVPNSRQIARAWNYNTDSLEKRLFVGNPGYVVKGINTGTSQGQDMLNTLSSHFFDNSKTPWDEHPAFSKDLIRFAFEAISNDDPNKSQALVFRAFLGSITDNHSAELNSFKYLGRGENFRTYQGFDRSISFSFKIFAQSDIELLPLYKKLNDLISQVYPDYSPVTSIMRAPLVRLTIGDYIYRTPGFLESVNVTIDGQATWEINNLKPENRPQLPHMVEVSISFKPIMDILPRRRTEKEIPALIANNQDTAIENVTNFIPVKAALYLNNTQDATKEVGQSQTSAEKEKALSNSLQMKVDLSAIKTPFKNLTAQQLTNNLSGKNNYNGG